MRKKIEKRKSKNWGDMDKLDDSLNKMEVLTKHLNELVEDVLNMSKLESDHMEIVNEPFDSKYYISQAYGECSPYAFNWRCITT